MKKVILKNVNVYEEVYDKNINEKKYIKKRK